MISPTVLHRLPLEMEPAPDLFRGGFVSEVGNDILWQEWRCWNSFLNMQTIHLWWFIPPVRLLLTSLNVCLLYPCLQAAPKTYVIVHQSPNGNAHEGKAGTSMPGPTEQASIRLSCESRWGMVVKQDKAPCLSIYPIHGLGLSSTSIHVELLHQGCLCLRNTKSGC